jgi:hypothetical protein
MKKEYIKPQTQVILLRQHSQLLAGSTMQMYGAAPEDIITDENEVW